MRRSPRAGWWFLAGVIIALVAPPVDAVAQGSTDTPTAAGTEYEFHGAFSGVRRLLYGSRYRSLWATPVAAPALSIGLPDSTADSTARTGFRWLWTPDGALWEYRPLDRDLVAVTPPSIRQNLLPSVIQGLNASRHPGAAPVVAALADAVGLRVAPAQLVRIVDSAASPRPGELGYLVAAGTEGRSTGEVLDSLRLDGGRQFDAVAYLRERLFDTYLGSVDDEPEAWRWIRADATGRWTPVPRDRERAFAKYDGFLAGLARAEVPAFVDFGVEYQERLGVMSYQRTLDRQLLALLDWTVWDSVTAAFQAALTDSVIAGAVQQLPAAYLPTAADPLVVALRARRDLLAKASRGLYRLVNQEAAFFGTPDADTVTVTRQPDGALSISFQGGFRRSYAPGETDAVALYLGGGADQLDLVGPGSTGPRLDVAWSPELVVHGEFGSGRRTTLYGGDRKIGATRAEVVSDMLPVPEVEDLDLTRPPAVPLHGTDVRPTLWFDVNSDVGLLIGGGVTLTTYRVGHNPYYRKLTIRSGYATATNNFAIELKGEFRRWRSREALTLDAGLSEIVVLHFFGYGNTTSFTQPSDFYLARQRQFYIYPAWNYSMTSRARVRVGPVFKHVRTDTLVLNYINLTRPYGVPDFAQVGVAATASYDTRDVPNFTRHGVYVRAGGTYYPILFGSGTPFGSIQASVAGYLTLPELPRLTLAARASGRLNMGEPPVHEAAFIGGSRTIRGYEAGRYAGAASAFGNTELRLHVATFPFVVPWQFGVVGLGDLGRVFNQGDNDDIWHGSAGGGIWFALPDRSLGGVMTIASSPQGTALWLNGGFMF